MNKRPSFINVLLIDDDEVDIESIYRSFEKINFPIKLSVVRNGIEAFDLLLKKNNKIKYVPQLIIMDINMPKMNGIDFLKLLRQNHSLDATKVLVFTTSIASKDKLNTAELNISGYLVKPINTEELRKYFEHMVRKK